MDSNSSNIRITHNHRHQCSPLLDICLSIIHRLLSTYKSPELRVKISSGINQSSLELIQNQVIFIWRSLTCSIVAGPSNDALVRWGSVDDWLSQECRLSSNVHIYIRNISSFVYIVSVHLHAIAVIVYEIRIYSFIQVRCSSR